MAKVKALNTLATELVGDGKKPNVFFVTKKGDVQTVTSVFSVAYQEWNYLSQARVECALEDRQHGVIASFGTDEDDSAKLVRIDDTKMFHLH